MWSAGVPTTKSSGIMSGVGVGADSSLSSELFSAGTELSSLISDEGMFSSETSEVLSETSEEISLEGVSVFPLQDAEETRQGEQTESLRFS